VSISASSSAPLLSSGFVGLPRVGEPSGPGLPASLAAAAFLAAARFSEVISSNSNGVVSMGGCMNVEGRRTG